MTVGVVRMVGMKNSLPPLVPGMTVKASDGQVTINPDLCMSYSDVFGAKVLSEFLRRRVCDSTRSKIERFNEEMQILRDFIGRSGERVEIVYP